MENQGTSIRMTLCALVAAGLLSACQPNTVPDRNFPSGSQGELVDRTLIVGEECPLPCWHGITPGETSFDEALDTLKSSPFVKSVLPYQNSRGIQWTSPFADWGGGVMTFDDSNLVDEIIYVLEYRLTAGELIDVQGDPDGIAIFYTSAPEQAPFGEVRIIWPEKGLIAIVSVRNMDQRLYATTPPIERTTRIDRVILVKPNPSAEEFTASFKQYYFPWRGYDPLPEKQ